MNGESSVRIAAYLWGHRRRVIAIWLAVVLLGGLYALLTPPVYTVRTVLFPKDGGSAPAGGSSLVLGAIGLASVQSTVLARMEILILSEDLSEMVVANANLLPRLYPDDWDAARKAWKDGRERTVREGAAEMTKMLRIGVGSKGYIELAVEGHDPVFIAKVLQGYLDALNTRMRSDAAADLKQNLDFLNRQLRETSDPVLIEKILALMASHIEGTMYANARAFDMIGDVRPPVIPNGPSRGLLLLVSVLLGFVAAVLAVALSRDAAAWVAEWKALRAGPGRA